MHRRLLFLKVILVSAVAALLVGACGGSAGKETLALSLIGLDPLTNGYHYEGWAIIDGSPVATGKFNVNANGSLVDLAGAIIENGEFDTGVDLSGASAIILTIEPAGDRDTVPADTHYLSGGITNLAANLRIGHSAALGDNFANASGVYILATPTDEDDTNENSGIWFLDLSSGAPEQGIQLLTLPTGWEYEGWTVINGTPVTTGRFTDIAATDLGAPYGGPLAGPPFPGEDFLNNAPGGLSFPTDLSAAIAVISVEPSPDDSPGPFTLKPLVGNISAGALDHVTYHLENKAGGFPYGTAVIK